MRWAGLVARMGRRGKRIDYWGSFRIVVTTLLLRWEVVRPTPNPPKLEDHLLSAVRGCLVNLFMHAGMQDLKWCVWKT
jgi:hypothetical protein